MDVTGVAGREPVERRHEIGSHVRVGVLLNGERSRGVTAEDGEAVGHPAVCDELSGSGRNIREARARGFDDKTPKRLSAGYGGLNDLDRANRSSFHDAVSLNGCCSVSPFAKILSSVSIRSASTAGLSQRMRLTRGKRMATPERCRLERCSPSKAISNTKPPSRP